MKFALSFLTAGLAMGILDSIWLSVVANKFYKSQIGKILLDKPNMVAAVAFYLIYLVGVVLFVIMPALEKESWQHAAIYGALFGFVAYATYDLTNLATLKEFTTKLVLVDLIWGALLTSVISAVSYWVVKTWI